MMKSSLNKGAITAGQLTRRMMLKGAIAGAVTLPGWLPAAQIEDDANHKQQEKNGATHYPFYGSSGQSGIATPPQQHIMYMTFDLTTTQREALQILLARWSATIDLLMQGLPIGDPEPNRIGGVGSETGEALDLGAASLTVTIGLGEKVFGENYGLSTKRPSKFRPLTALPSDNFQPELTGGDLSLQACAEDPQVAYHAIRVLARIANHLGSASTRWTVMGFGRAAASAGQSTPRNLFGFKDGTRNIKQPTEMNNHVWIQSPAAERWGTYQVVRKIRMHIETWDTDRVSDQNRIFGRHKISGAPLSGQQEFDTPDFSLKDNAGDAVIPLNSHIRLAAHENNQGIQILRRSYNYTDGLNQLGQLDAGLLFISYQNDPEHFEKLQRKLGASDALNEYISHIGSALFYIPPAPKVGSYIGAELFAD